MGQKTDDLKIKRIKRDYLSGNGNLKTIAAKHGVSYPTAMRYKKAGNWDADKEVVEQAGETLGEAIALSASGTINQIELIETAIRSLTAKMEKADVKSLEGGIMSLVRLLDAYRDRKPETMEEMVDLALSVPNFDPREFARLLRLRAG
jgi:hypothetical protein